MINKETISDRQGISIMLLFIIGISIVYIPGLEAGKDVWIAVFVSTICSIPVIAIYVRLMNLFPGNDLFDIIIKVSGKYIGKIIIVLYLIYTILLCATILRSLCNFIVEIGLLATPIEVTLFFMFILAAWIVKEGIESIGRFSEILIIIIVLIIIFTFLLLIPQFEINNIRPLLSTELNKFILGTFRLFIFPFTELVIFTMVFNGFRSKKSSKKIFFSSLFIGGFLGAIYTLIVILVVGESFAKSTYFPSYLMVRRISIGAMIQRIEILAVVFFVVTTFIKGSTCLLACTKGITKLVNSSNYRLIVMPVTVLSFILAFWLYDTCIDLYFFYIEIWPYFAALFQVILPLIILIISEIWIRKNVRSKLKS